MSEYKLLFFRTASAVPSVYMIGRYVGSLAGQTPPSSGGKGVWSTSHHEFVNTSPLFFRGVKYLKQGVNRHDVARTALQWAARYGYLTMAIYGYVHS